MTTAIRIAGWKAEGLRCPDHEVSFLDAFGNPHAISLLQMPNGTGKTTTLELLRAALSGSAARGQWSEETVRSFAKRGNEDGDGHFRLDGQCNGRRFTVALNFSFSEGTVAYSTTLTSGIRDGFHPPRDAISFMREGFVNFFVFDGELAERLLSRKHTNAESVLADLFHLNLLSQLARRVDEYWEQQIGRVNAKDERGFTRRKNRVDRLKQRLATLRKERDSLEVQRADTEKDLKAKKARFSADIARSREVNERLRAAEAALATAESELEKSSADCLARFRDPEAVAERFAMDMSELKRSLDRAKLPESAAREFFEELAQEDECICGRPLDADTRAAIRERAERYLGSDDVSFLNAMKGDVAKRIAPPEDAPAKELVALLSSLGDERRTLAERRTARDRVETEAIEGDPELEEAHKDIVRFEGELRACDEQLSKFDDEVESDDSMGIQVLEARLADAEKALAEITDTLNLKKRRDVLLTLLSKAENRAREAVEAEVTRETNERIRDVIPDNQIRVDKIDRCLVLEGQEGGSVGETLSVAYAFLATLFTRSEHSVPFLVDSPANPIDLRVRAKVAELIPKLAGQFIAFTISSERQGFVEPLERAAPGLVQFQTLFRKGPTELEDSARKEASMVETDDGIRVGGRGFFDRFHLEDEA